MFVLDLVIDLLQHKLADDADSLLFDRRADFMAVHRVVEDFVRLCKSSNENGILYKSCHLKNLIIRRT